MSLEEVKIVEELDVNEIDLTKEECLQFTNLTLRRRLANSEFNNTMQTIGMDEIQLVSAIKQRTGEDISGWNLDFDQQKATKPVEQ